VACLFIFAPFQATGYAAERMRLSGYPNTPEEINALPRWLQIVVLTGPKTNPPAHLMREREKLIKKYGKPIHAAHHFAAAVNWINRYYKSLGTGHWQGDADRKMALETALGEFRFMRGGWLTPKDIFYYSMLMYEATIYELQGNLKSAAKNYHEVIKLKPKYALAYVKYANLLESVGKPSAAVKILKKGLKKTKGAKIIKKKMETLNAGGQSK